MKKGNRREQNMEIEAVQQVTLYSEEKTMARCSQHGLLILRGGGNRRGDSEEIQILSAVVRMLTEHSHRLEVYCCLMAAVRTGESGVPG